MLATLCCSLISTVSNPVSASAQSAQPDSSNTPHPSERRRDRPLPSWRGADFSKRSLACPKIHPRSRSATDRQDAPPCPTHCRCRRRCCDTGGCDNTRSDGLPTSSRMHRLRMLKPECRSRLCAPRCSSLAPPWMYHTLKHSNSPKHTTEREAAIDRWAWKRRCCGTAPSGASE